MWSRPFAGAASGAGPVVGNLIDLSRTEESSTGDVLNWQNLQAEGDSIGAFRHDPTVLPIGSYAYDWQQRIMYVNVGADPNSGQLGISCVGRFVSTLAGSSPSTVTVHPLRLTGFARENINIIGSASCWHIHHNKLYAIGAMHNASAKWYFGSGIQMSQNANHIEIEHNRIIQTFDSPITPQHFGGSPGGHLHDLYIHHNFIDRWALGAVEMSDFGTDNQFSNILIENNSAINGGEGLSRIGDTPQGYTDGIQVRGGFSSSFSGLVVRDYQINAHDANVLIGGSNFNDPVILDDNTFSAAKYGIENRRPDTATIDAANNTLCANDIQVADKAANSLYINNTIVADSCAIP